jgi:predicted lipoprotein with Yx(FWY)xxD motif
MMTLFQRRGRPAALPAAAAALTLGLVSVALQFSSTASAQSSSCADSLTSAPTGPATVSAASSPFGNVLVVGSGPLAGCSLYMLTSDQLHALKGRNFACSDNVNLLGSQNPCDAVLWPALLTNGAPIAGPGVNPALLGTVTRTDLPGISSAQQVTYAGQPLYRFFKDDVPGDTQGANLDDPVTSPPGIWYLVNPDSGNPATGQAQLQLETAPIDGNGTGHTVLAANMNNDFTDVFPNVTFPVYTLSTNSGQERGGASACQGLCAVYWPPVLTSELPVAGPGVDQNALGTIVRPDGTQQVTDHGEPLYLFNKDAYIAPIPGAGTQSINGAHKHTRWGVFNTIPPLQ